MNQLFRSDSTVDEKSLIAQKLMQQVQSCPWNPFSLSEIVTLEKCLKEVSHNDANLASIFKKIVEKGKFVEPSRKAAYLVRNEKDRQVDASYRRRMMMVKSKIAQLDDELEYLRSKKLEVSEGEEETREAIRQLKRSTLLMEKTLDMGRTEFELMLEQVTSSFDKSISTLNTIIPDFLGSVPKCNLLTKSSSISDSYERRLKSLVRDGEVYERDQKLALQLSADVKQHNIWALKSHLGALSRLYRDLALIDQVYASEAAEEAEYLRTVKTHIEYLKRPFKEAPRRTSVDYADDDEDLYVPIYAPEMRSRLVELEEDAEFSSLLAAVCERLKMPAT